MGSEYRELVLGREFMDLLDAPEAKQEPVADISGLAEALIANLESQRGVYADYLAAAERQKMALVNHRLDENHEANQAGEKAISLLGELETERLAIAERIVAARPDIAPTAAQLRCEALYPKLEAPLADRLKQARHTLRRSIESLQRVLNVNEALVQNGSRIIHTTIGIITSVVGRARADKLTTYSKKGVTVGKVQIRNLINRSV